MNVYVYVCVVLCYMLCVGTRRNATRCRNVTQYTILTHNTM